MTYDLLIKNGRMVELSADISHGVVNRSALYRDGRHTGNFPRRVFQGM